MRKEIFQTGVRYRIKKDFICGGVNFTAGDIFTFDRDGYSPYDDCYIYEFHDHNGNARIWTLTVDSKGDEWLQHFEELP